MPNLARRAILYGVLALCLCGFAYVQGRSDESAAVTFSEATALLGHHGAYQRVIDSLKGAEARYVGLEGYYRRLADSLGRRTMVTPVASSAGDTASKSGLASTDSLRVIFLGRALDACDASRSAADSALALCRVRGDSLEAALRGVLAIKTCRLPFGIPCPSRGALFVLGAVSGAILENRLTH